MNDTDMDLELPLTQTGFTPKLAYSLGKLKLYTLGDVKKLGVLKLKELGVTDEQLVELKAQLKLNAELDLPLEQVGFSEDMAATLVEMGFTTLRHFLQFDAEDLQEKGITSLRLKAVRQNLKARNRYLLAEQPLTMAQQMQLQRLLATEIPKLPKTGKHMGQSRYFPFLDSTDLVQVYFGRTMLAMCNDALVHSAARNYLWALDTGVFTFDDLQQFGKIGIIKAAARFRPKRGYRFSTYATHWVRQEIGRGVCNRGVIEIPPHANDDAVRYIKVAKELGPEVQKKGLLGAIQAKLRFSDEKFAATCTAVSVLYKKQVHLDQGARDEEGGSSLYELLNSGAVDDESSRSEKKLSGPEVVVAVQTAMNNAGLNPREKKILALRYGFGSGEEETLEEVGKRIGCTRERVRQIQSKALGRLGKLDCWTDKPEVVLEFRGKLLSKEHAEFLEQAQKVSEVVATHVHAHDRVNDRTRTAAPAHVPLSLEERVKRSGLLSPDELEVLENIYGWSGKSECEAVKVAQLCNLTVDKIHSLHRELIHRLRGHEIWRDEPMRYRKRRSAPLPVVQVSVPALTTPTPAPVVVPVVPPSPPPPRPEQKVAAQIIGSIRTLPRDVQLLVIEEARAQVSRKINCS